MRNRRVLNQEGEVFVVRIGENVNEERQKIMLNEQQAAGFSPKPKLAHQAWRLLASYVKGIHPTDYGKK